MNGNRYAAVLEPQAGGQPSQAGPPMPPPNGAPSGPPQGQPDAAQPNPALVEAFQILSGHEGPIADLLKDPANLPHIRIAFDAVKQDPAVQQQLAQIGITPVKLQQFEAMLVQAEQGGKTQAAPHWLTQGR